MTVKLVADIDSLVTQVRNDGFCVIPDIIPAAKCDAMQERLTTVALRWRRAEKLRELKTSYVPGLINFDQSCAEYIAAEPVLAVVEQLLGRNLRVSFTTLLTSEPQRKAFDLARRLAVQPDERLPSTGTVSRFVHARHGAADDLSILQGERRNTDRAGQPSAANQPERSVAGIRPLFGASGRVFA